MFSNESCELANLRSITPVAKVICMHFLVRPTHFGRSCNNVDSRRSVTHSQCSAIQQKMLRQQTAMQWTSYAPRTRTCTRGHWICNSNITLRLLFNSAHRGSKKWRYGWWISLFALCQFALSFGFQCLKNYFFLFNQIPISETQSSLDILPNFEVWSSLSVSSARPKMISFVCTFEVDCLGRNGR